MKRCFPTAEVVVTDSVTNAVIAFNQGRADAVMFDDTSLALIAATDPSVEDDGRPEFLEAPSGIGIRQGNTALKRWVDSRLEHHEAEGQVRPDHPDQHRVPRFVPSFLEERAPGRTTTSGYRSASLPSIDTVCP